MRIWWCAGFCPSCSLVDSVEGHAGPPGYCLAHWPVCDAECGRPNNCGSRINGLAGYSPGATSCSDACGRNACGNNVTCTRNRAFGATRTQHGRE